MFFSCSLFGTIPSAQARLSPFLFASFSLHCREVRDYHSYSFSFIIIDIHNEQKTRFQAENKMVLINITTEGGKKRFPHFLITDEQPILSCRLPSILNYMIISLCRLPKGNFRKSSANEMFIYFRVFFFCIYALRYCLCFSAFRKESVWGGGRNPCWN